MSEPSNAPGHAAAGAQQPSLSDLAPGDRAWVEENLARGAEMGVDLADPATLEELFDGALDDVRSGEQKPGIRNDVIGVVACNLGELLARRHGFDWHKYRDAGGYELCLHDHGTGWVLMPISAVGKRWDNGDIGWIRGFVDSVAAELAAGDAEQ